MQALPLSTWSGTVGPASPVTAAVPIAQHDDRSAWSGWGPPPLTARAGQREQTQRAAKLSPLQMQRADPLASPPTSPIQQGHSSKNRARRERRRGAVSPDPDGKHAIATAERATSEVTLPGDEPLAQDEGPVDTRKKWRQGTQTRDLPQATFKMVECGKPTLEVDPDPSGGRVQGVPDGRPASAVGTSDQAHPGEIALGGGDDDDSGDSYGDTIEPVLDETETNDAFQGVRGGGGDPKSTTKDVPGNHVVSARDSTQSAPRGGDTNGAPHRDFARAPSDRATSSIGRGVRRNRNVPPLSSDSDSESDDNSGDDSGFIAARPHPTGRRARAGPVADTRTCSSSRVSIAKDRQAIDDRASSASAKPKPAKPLVGTVPVDGVVKTIEPSKPTPRRPKAPPTVLAIDRIAHDAKTAVRATSGGLQDNVSLGVGRPSILIMEGDVLTCRAHGASSSARRTARMGVYIGDGWVVHAARRPAVATDQGHVRHVRKSADSVCAEWAHDDDHDDDGDDNDEKSNNNKERVSSKWCPTLFASKAANEVYYDIVQQTVHDFAAGRTLTSDEWFRTRSEHPAAVRVRRAIERVGSEWEVPGRMGDARASEDFAMWVALGQSALTYADYRDERGSPPPIDKAYLQHDHRHRSAALSSPEKKKSKGTGIVAQAVRFAGNGGGDDRDKPVLARIRPKPQATPPGVQPLPAPAEQANGDYRRAVAGGLVGLYLGGPVGGIVGGAAGFLFDSVVSMGPRLW